MSRTVYKVLLIEGDHQEKDHYTGLLEKVAGCTVDVIARPENLA